MELVYSEFKNAASQRFISETFLPVQKVSHEGRKKGPISSFEPSQSVLIAELMPKILNTQLYKGGIGCQRQ